jgi:hypothetical protein
MIALNTESQNNASEWQTAFTKMLPEINRWLRLAFRQLGPEAREDAIEEGIVHSLLSYSRLHGKGRAEKANASSLAWYAVRAVKRGRPAVGRVNGKEPLSRYAQVGNGIRFERHDGQWIDKLVADKRASVPDQVAAKLDVRAWFATLTHRTKQIAKELAVGCSTSEVARKHGVTAGRISQLRRSLEQSWLAFQQEISPALDL